MRNKKSTSLIISLIVYGVSFGIFYGTVMTKLNALEKKQDKQKAATKTQTDKKDGE